MPSMKMKLKAELEDGRVLDITADQRDIASWEVQPFGCSYYEARDQKTFSWLRYLAWHALRRTGKIPAEIEWDNFDQVCVEVEAVPEKEGEGSSADVVDPGRPARSAGSTSS